MIIFRIVAVQNNFATLNLIEAHQQVHQRRFACSRRANNGQLLAGINFQADFVKQQFIGVAKVYFIKLNLAGYFANINGFRARLNGLFRIQERENP